MVREKSAMFKTFFCKRKYFFYIHMDGQTLNYGNITRLYMCGYKIEDTVAYVGLRATKLVFFFIKTESVYTKLILL